MKRWRVERQKGSMGIGMMEREGVMNRSGGSIGPCRDLAFSRDEETRM